MRFDLYSAKTPLIPAIILLASIPLLGYHALMLLGGGGHAPLIAIIGLIISVIFLLFCLYALIRRKTKERSMYTFYALFFGGCTCLFVKFFGGIGFPILLRLAWLPLLLFSLFFLFRHKLPKNFRNKEYVKI